ncbi:MAG: MASE3 domain-containing protein [Deltaproteobacteria bacterium]
MTDQANTGIFGKERAIKVLMSIAAIVLILVATRMYSYLLFHSMAELLTVSFAFTIFLLVWNSRSLIDNGYIKFIGIGYAVCAVIDLIHMLAFKGMNIFTGYDANLPTQLWMAARFLQAMTLAAAPFAYRKTLRLEVIVVCFSLAALFLVGATFSGVFPDCYREGIGLTLSR